MANFIELHSHCGKQPFLVNADSIVYISKRDNGGVALHLSHGYGMAFAAESYDQVLDLLPWPIRTVCEDDNPEESILNQIRDLQDEVFEDVMKTTNANKEEYSYG